MKVCTHSIFIFLFFLCSVCQSQETYTIGKTEYYFDEYYSTTGNPKVKRSEANKRAFLRTKGYNVVPDGYEVDHIIPLSQGGADDARNMQLPTIAEHDRKTARERAANNSSNFSTTPKTFFATLSTNYYFKNNLSSPELDSKGRLIYKGPRGGEYYLSSNGNKVYVKSNSNNYLPKPHTAKYSKIRTIYTGPRGGKYYINSNGNKTYVKKNN